MNFVEAFLFALALCVDSLVVSTTTAFRSKMSYRRGFLMAFIFGLCQGIFPLAGALIGDIARSFIESVDHWIAFGLLLYVGGKMIVEAVRNNAEDSKILDSQLSIINIFLLGVATSIDAFAVGIGLGLDNPIGAVLWIVALIGVVTLVVSMVGVYLGKRNIPVPERTANIIAGIVLIGLGTKILLEHLIG